MAKRKKKQSEHTKLKLAEAHRRNEFFYKLNYLITAVTGDASVYRLIPQYELDKMFLLRFKALRVKAAPGHTIRPDILEEIRKTIIFIMKRTTERYTPNGPVITLGLYSTAGMSLFTYLLILKDDFFPAAKAFSKALEIVTFQNDEDDTTDVLGILEEHLDTLQQLIPFMMNDFQDTVYWIDRETISNERGMPTMFYQLRVHSQRAECRHFNVGGINRPAYRVCWGYADEGLIKLSLKSSQLELPAGVYPESLPVYIQSHALLRLKERIDCTESFIFPSSIFCSLSNCKYYKKPGNSYLVAYSHNNKNVGYLFADIQNGAFLVHTFLFLTHSGTPEGNKLLAKTGLGKLDKAYLNIDKLSAFYNTDIADNPEIKKIFVDAGCGDLFDIEPYMFKDTHEGPKIKLADKIRSYLGFENTEDYFETYDKEQMPESGY